MKYLLIAEDEPDLRAAYEEFFRPPEYEVVAVSNGKEATRWIRREKFEVILSDYKMPWVDGQELYNRIRKLSGYEKSPIVFVTGFAGEIPSAITSDPNVSIVEKPVSLQVLKEHIDGQFLQVQDRRKNEPKQKIDIELIDAASKAAETTLIHMTDLETIAAARPFVFRASEPIVSDVIESVDMDSPNISGSLSLLYRSDTYLWVASSGGAGPYKKLSEAAEDQGGRTAKAVCTGLLRRLKIESPNDIDIQVRVGEKFRSRGRPPIVIPIRTGFGELHVVVGLNR